MLEDTGPGLEDNKNLKSYKDCSGKGTVCRRRLILSYCSIHYFTVLFSLFLGFSLRGIINAI